MNSSISRGLTMVAASSLFLALAIGGLGPASAATPPNYTCVADVSTALSPAALGPSGAANLGTHVVTGATVAQALHACHVWSLGAFAGNSAWSNPEQFCARYSLPNYEITLGQTSHTRMVWVTDYLQEIGHAAGYYRIGGYSVVCNGPINLVPVSSNPTLVPNWL